MSQFDQDVAEMQEWMTGERFAETRRLYSPRQVVAQRGTIHADYTIARQAAEGFYKRLRELAATQKSITTYGPYSPGQAVTMKRTGIEGIYLGGWATSAKGSINEDPGADLASYPLSQVPDEAAPIVRALLSADKNQFFARSRMTEAERAATPEVNFAPYIIADADTGHGGDAHVRNLVRRFVEAGVPGYHIEDQKPGAKKCGHQGGKVLVPIAEQIKRLNAARLQLDIMKVPGIIVARTDAEAATLLDGRSDERDHPFILGATNVDAPRLKVVSLAVLKRIHELGITDINGHLLYRVADADYERTYQWMARTGVLPFLEEQVAAFETSGEPTVDPMLARINSRVFDAWQAQAALKTYPEAIADAMEFMRDDGNEFDISVEEWRAFANGVSFSEARARARALGINIIWNCDHCMTPEGYYQIKSGMDYAIARSIAVAPYCDLIWMETKTANLPDAKEFAEAIHAEWPGKMLAYNLSPSFNWDTTGMSDDEMRAFPKGLGELGYVFNFITYGGHQLDGLAGEEFTANLMQDGMLALARLQRKFRLVDSPYKTPQTLVGGPRLDATLMATSGRTAATKAMGKGSTQFQHLVQTEIPVKLLEGWLKLWTEAHKIERVLRPMLRPYKPGSEVMELSILDGTWRDEIDQNTIGKKLANIVFEPIHDRLGANILSIRDQNNFDTSLRRKRLMTLAHLFLIHRYKTFSLHYVRPSDDNHKQAEALKALKLFSDVQTEVGQIIVVAVDREQVEELVAPDQAALKQLLGLEAAS